MKLKESVEVAYVNVISKFGYDQINISFRNVLLKHTSNPSKFAGKIIRSHFCPKWCNYIYET